MVNSTVINTTLVNSNIKKIIIILHKLFQNIEEGGILPNSLRSSIIIILKISNILLKISNMLQEVIDQYFLMKKNPLKS